MPLKPIAANHGSEKKVYLLKPRGFCAGVVRAIDVVKIALDLYGPPVYVRKEIVHNKHVVDELREAGAIFVEEIGEGPVGGGALFSPPGGGSAGARAPFSARTAWLRKCAAKLRHGAWRSSTPLVRW